MTNEERKVWEDAQQALAAVAQRCLYGAIKRPQWLQDAQVACAAQLALG